MHSILLVDDDSICCFLNQHIVKTHFPEAKITIKNNGLEAIEFLAEQEQNPPDVILLDINMPEMDGWDFLKEYKKRNWNNNFNSKISMLSSSLRKSDLELASEFEDVIKQYLVKPLTKEDFKEKISK